MGIVEPVEEGIWRVPQELLERARPDDAKRAPGAVLDLRSELSIVRQVRAIGVTGLDRPLVGGSEVLTPKGFGAEVRQTLAEREVFRMEQGFAERRGQRVVLMRDLLATLRTGDVEQAARAIEADSGLVHRPIADGQTVSGVYPRSVALVSGRFAVLDDGVGFSRVPWASLHRQVIGPIRERRGTRGPPVVEIRQAARHRGCSSAIAWAATRGLLHRCGNCAEFRTASEVRNRSHPAGLSREITIAP